MTLEFTYNDERDGGYTKPSRQAFEQLLRKLLRLPSRCVLLRGCGCVVACSMAGPASLLVVLVGPGNKPAAHHLECLLHAHPLSLRPCLW